MSACSREFAGETFGDGRLRGLVFTRQFPNDAEPYRGTFVEQQVVATSPEVDWRVLAPPRWVPFGFERLLGRARVVGRRIVRGIDVTYVPYPVLPRRMLYRAVAPSMAAFSAGAFRRLVREAGACFVHAHELYPSGAAAARLVEDAHMPLVVSVHGSDLYSNLSRQSWRAALVEVARRSAAIVCVGHALAENVEVMLGADPARIHVVPDCYDDDAFAYIDREMPENRTLRFLTVGRLVPEKGLDVLLRAVASLIAQGHDVSLRIVGAGFLAAELESLRHELGLGERVTFLGPLATNRLQKEYAAADLYVQPSRREGFGLALVEAMATGLPAVATASGGPSDIMSSDCGILVEPDDVRALTSGLSRAIVTFPEFDRAAIADRMRDRYGREAVGEALVRVYRSVLAEVGLDA